MAHLEYAASLARGRELGGLDGLLGHLLNDVNSDEGRALNVGLIEQKEGFGARACVHDFYELSL